MGQFDNIIPVKVTSGHTIWLEHYTQIWRLNLVKNRYVNIGTRVVNIGPGLKWQIIEEISL